MEKIYKLMHKDTVCGSVSIDSENGALNGFTLYDKTKSPFLGNANLRLMKRWWEARSIPASRQTMQEIIKKAGCISSKEYLEKNLALSMTDAYWICPINIDISWKDINLYEHGEFFAEGLQYHNATSYDPNATLGGQMDKYWDMHYNPPVLTKIAYKEYGQQALNEALASAIHQLQNKNFPYVKYWTEPTNDNGIKCMCHAFTNEKIELVPAMEILDSKKFANNISLYDAFIKVCTENGIDEEYIRDFMDYQTLTDFVISNTDKHLLNYGIIRDSDSLNFIGPAPIYDSGNSMFYLEHRTQPYKRHELLSRKITAIHDKEEAMLKHISNREIISEDLLPHPKEIEQFYEQNGIPEEKAKFIAGSYEQKLSLLHDFLKGKTISYYMESRKTHKSVESLLQHTISKTEKAHKSKLLDIAHTETR